MEIGAVPVGGCAKHRKMCDHTLAVSSSQLWLHWIWNPGEFLRGNCGFRPLENSWGTPSQPPFLESFASVIHLTWDPRAFKNERNWSNNWSSPIWSANLRICESARNWSSRFLHLPSQVCMGTEVIRQHKTDLAEKKKKKH